MKKLLIILGTDREGARSKKVAEALKSHINENFELEVDIADPTELDFSYNHSDEKYKKMADEADCFLIVSPEYNHSFPGTLKTLLDSEFDVYKRKNVAICGVSAGPWGGTRMIESLSGVLKAFNMVLMRYDINVKDAGNAVDDKGNLRDDIVKQVPKVVEQLVS